LYLNEKAIYQIKPEKFNYGEGFGKFLHLLTDKKQTKFLGLFYLMRLRKNKFTLCNLSEKKIVFENCERSRIVYLGTQGRIIELNEDENLFIKTDIGL
jgi:hypothetical protein